VIKNADKGELVSDNDGAENVKRGFVESAFKKKDDAKERELFELLWEHRNGDPLTQQQLLDVLYPITPERLIHPKNPEVRLSNKQRLGRDKSSVRHLCSEVRRKLEKHFTARPDDPYHIIFRPGGVYRLIVVPRNTTNGVRKFWDPHFDSGREVHAVHAEYSFYTAIEIGLVWRFYDCNERIRDPAVAQLKRKLDEPNLKEFRRIFTKMEDNIGVTSPYVAWGDSAGLSKLVKCFEDTYFEAIEPTILRHKSRDAQRKILQQSLILLGTAPANTAIRNVLDRYSSDFSMQLKPTAVFDGKRTCRVTLVNPDEAERQQFNKYKIKFVPSEDPSRWMLETYPEERKALVILTRVPNWQAEDEIPNPITMIEADYSRAIFQMAALLADKDRLGGETRGKDEWPDNLPPYFQALFIAQTRDPLEPDKALFVPEPLTFLTCREYKP
jgi:hypothetical protein